MLIDLRVKHDVGAWGHPVVPFDSGMGCWVVSCANSLRILIARTKRSRQQRSSNLLANSWASNLRLVISPTGNEGPRPAVLQTA